MNQTNTPFDALGLSDDLVQVTRELGYSTASPIQEKAIPVVLAGHDLLAAAQTGTGKTAGFLLPLLDLLEKGKPAQNNKVRALIITPTRELAAQIGDCAEQYGRRSRLRSQVVYGGVKINPQMMALRKGADILVATPGRLLDLYQQGAVKFDQLETLVLDEADRMLDMGFIHDIRKIIAILPVKRQTLMFSATFSDDIRELARKLVVNAQEVSVTPANSTADTVTQWLVPADKNRKSRLLIHLIKENDWQQVLVFSRTKHGANRLARNLESAGVSACAIHGNKSQGARTRALADFRSGAVRVMVATDIAARGLDIDHLPQVVNFDLPNVSEDYVHRIGRTGRAGAGGEAVSLVCAEEAELLRDIESLIGKRVERKTVKGFEPAEELAVLPLKQKSAKPKKPKKAKPKHPRGQSASGGNHSSSAAGKEKPARRRRPAHRRKPAEHATA